MNQSPNDRLDNEMPDDILERAIALHQREPVPPGPPPTLTASTLLALLETEQPPARSLPFVSRMKMMKTMTTAAGLLVAVTACVVFGVLFRTQSTLAFTQLIDPILKAKSARFNMVIESKSLVPQTVRMLVLEPNRFRQEMPSGQISIWDGGAGKHMTLTPAQKTAILVKTTDVPPEQKTANYFDHLRTNLRAADTGASSKRDPLGRKVIAGREVIGFRVQQPLGDMTIWGDPKTGLPILVEMVSAILPDGKVTMSDFEFDVELDESLFKTEPPEGYTVQEFKTATPAEKDVIRALKLLSDDNEGLFPDAFNHTAISAFIANQVQKRPAGGSTAAMTKEVTELTLPLSQGLVFAALLPVESNARYAGKGVKNNDATQAVFWYKPAGAAKYRVIFGDLSIKEQDAAPESPNAVPVTLAVNVDDSVREMTKRIKSKQALPGPEAPQEPAPPETPAAARVEAKPDDPAARQIITQMMKTYAECKTYRDSGIVTRRYDMNNDHDFTTKSNFTTAFVRPDRFRFESKDIQGDRQTRSVIWSNGKQFQTWWDLKPEIEKHDSLRAAMAASGGRSSVSADRIPAILMPNEISGGMFEYFKVFKGLTLTEDGKLDKVECFRLEALYGKHPITVWIDKKAYLVRRIDEQMQIPNGCVETTTTYDPVFDEEIPDKLLEFDPPAGN